MRAVFIIGLALTLLPFGVLTAWADPAFTDIAVLPGPTHHTVHASVLDDHDFTTRFSVKVPNAGTRANFYGAQDILGVTGRVSFVSRQALQPLPWPQLSGAELGPLLMKVPFDPDDKAVQQGDPGTYPYGFGSFQKHGPEYDFFVGKYEVTNEEFARFLNSAQGQPGTFEGLYMFFDAVGDIRFNPLGEGSSPSDYDLFTVSDSRLSYDPSLPVGLRYVVDPEFAQHPVAGVSWYGALKYCNWLTLDRGMGASERCYHEGFNPEDWRPVTADSWPSFTDAERAAWVAGFAGYRLPMLHSAFGTSSKYNEYLKAAAWIGVGISDYAYGRLSITTRDANYSLSGDPFGGTSPVGYYDGVQPLRFRTTNPNNNMHGIYDMCGNVNEWLNDSFSSSGLRAFAGGSFLAPSSTCGVRDEHAGTPRTTLRDLGFRIASGSEVRSGTNVNEVIPLSISPSQPIELTVPGQVLFAGLGGTGLALWSVDDAALGSLSAASGTVVVYSSTSEEGVQEVVLSDGTTAVTTTVTQVGQVLPPTPPTPPMP